MPTPPGPPADLPDVPLPTPPADEPPGFPSPFRVWPLSPFAERWWAKERDYLRFVEAWDRANERLGAELGWRLPDALADDWQASWVEDLFRGFIPQDVTIPPGLVPSAVEDVAAGVCAIRFVHPNRSSLNAHRFWAYTLPDDPALGHVPTVEEVRCYRPDLDPRAGLDGQPGDRSLFGQYDRCQFLDRAGFLLGSPTGEDWRWLRRLAYRADPFHPIWDGPPHVAWARHFRRAVPVLSLLLDIGHDPRIEDESTPFQVLIGLVQNWCRTAREAVARRCGPAQPPAVEASEALGSVDRFLFDLHKRASMLSARIEGGEGSGSDFAEWYRSLAAHGLEELYRLTGRARGACFQAQLPAGLVQETLQAGERAAVRLFNWVPARGPANEQLDELRAAINQLVALRDFVRPGQSAAHQCPESPADQQAVGPDPAESAVTGRPVPPPAGRGDDPPRRPDRRYRVEPWGSDQVPQPHPDFPPPAAGRLVWVHELGDVFEGRPCWRVGWRWAEGEEDGWTCMTDGFMVCGPHPPAGCDWLPCGWTARVFPLGRTPAHVECWGRFVSAMLATKGEHLSPDDPQWGWQTLTRATRLLAHQFGVIGPDRLTDRYPASREEARREVGPLLDALLTAARPPGVPPPTSLPPPPSPVPEPAVTTDGPADGYRFGWDGVGIEFSRSERRLYRLLVAVWPAYRTRGPLRVDDVVRRIEDAGGSAVERKTLANYARDLSEILTGRVRFPSRVEVDGDYVRWVDLPEAAALP